MLAKLEKNWHGLDKWTLTIESGSSEMHELFALFQIIKTYMNLKKIGWK